MCTRQGALLLGCGPRKDLAPPGSVGQDQTSQGGREKLVSPDPGRFWEGTSSDFRRDLGPLCFLSLSAQRSAYFVSACCAHQAPVFNIFANTWRETAEEHAWWPCALVHILPLARST